MAGGDGGPLGRSRAALRCAPPFTSQSICLNKPNGPGESVAQPWPRLVGPLKEAQGKQTRRAEFIGFFIVIWWSELGDFDEPPPPPPPPGRGARLHVCTLHLPAQPVRNKQQTHPGLVWGRPRGAVPAPFIGNLCRGRRLDLEAPLPLQVRRPGRFYRLRVAPAPSSNTRTGLGSRR